jgi:hypothetical protein
MRVAENLECRIGARGPVMQREDLTEDSVHHKRDSVNECFRVMHLNGNRTHGVEAVRQDDSGRGNDNHFVQEHRLVMLQNYSLRAAVAAVCVKLGPSFAEA